MITRQPDGGQFEREEGQEQAKPTSRTLVYDAESGSLRFTKPRAAFKPDPKSPSPNFTPSTQKLVSEGKITSLAASQHSVLGRLQGEDGSGESSPTCVIRNSALRSNSCSPTMSTVSKASSEVDRQDYQEAKQPRTKCGGNSPSEDDEGFFGASPGSDLQKLGGGRSSKKLGGSTPGRPGMQGAFSQRAEKDSSSSKENGWSIVDAVRDAQAKESQTAPFKAVQTFLTEKVEEAKKKHGGIPSCVVRPSPQSASVMNGTASIFSFNATYMPRGTDREHYEYDHNSENPSCTSFDFNRVTGHRTAMGSLLKPTPSKWDDAEKWLQGSEVPVRTKARSGPLLAQMVAGQAGIAVPRKTPLSAQNSRHSGPPNGLGPAKAAGLSDSEGSSQDSAEIEVHLQEFKTIETPKLGGGGASFGFGSVDKEQPCVSVDRFSLEDLQARDDGNAKEGSTSPQSNGSFLKPMRIDKPVCEPPTNEDGDNGDKTEQSSQPVPAAPSESPTMHKRTVSVRDMGTEMTPIASVEPSRTATPIRATTPEKTPVGSRSSTPKRSHIGGANCKRTIEPKGSKETAETPKILTGKELQAKTRQEILALGTQLGKANIAAWATKEEEEADAAKSLKTTLDLEEVRKTLLATRAAAWEEAEQAKYISRFQREEAKIQAWENHEKAKAEAEMRRIEVKVERMRSHANEKLMNKLASARRRSEELRAAAEARRSEEAAKAARKAEIIKKTGKIPGVLFLNLLCT